MDVCELLCTLQDAVADGETQQVLSILKKAPPNVASLLLTSSLDDENTTLLHISASHPSADILTALLRHGAEVDWQNFDGLTALHVAATWGSREVVRTLMENGANPLIRDGEGLLPVDHARSKGHVECVHLLEGHSVNDDHTLSDDDYTHSDLEREEEEPQDEQEMSMVEAYVSMYSNSDTEFEDDLTSVTLDLDLSDYDYTPPAPMNQTGTYPSPSRYSLTSARQRLVYSPSPCKSTSEATKPSDRALHHDCNNEDSVLYTTAVEESFMTDASTTVVGGVRGGVNSVEGGASKFNGTYTLASSGHCMKDSELGKQVDQICDEFSNLTTSTSQSRNTGSALHSSSTYQSGQTGSLSKTPTHQLRQTSSAACTTPPSSTNKTRQTGSSSSAALSHQSGKSNSTPSPMDCSFAADIQVRIPEKLKSLTESELRERLVALGERPGPITPSTKVAYLAYLAKLEDGLQPAGNKGYKGYKYELALVLNGTVPLPDLTQLEQQVFKMFRTPSTSIFTPSPVKTHWSQNSTSSASTKKDTSISRQATPLSPFKTPPPFGSPRAAKDRGTKDHFNYLLLDPRVLERLFPAYDMSTLISDDVIICGDGALNELEKFRVFVESVFYVGKGKNSRSMQHLKDAKDCLTLKKTKLSSKLRYILGISSAGFGVVSLQLFHNTTASEAFTREACIIEAIGLGLLTNIQRGHVYGDVSGWSLPRRRQLGVHLLHKAYQSYKLHPPQQIYQGDL